MKKKIKNIKTKKDTKIIKLLKSSNLNTGMKKNSKKLENLYVKFVTLIRVIKMITRDILTPKNTF